MVLDLTIGEKKIPTNRELSLDFCSQGFYIQRNLITSFLRKGVNMLLRTLCCAILLLQGLQVACSQEEEQPKPKGAVSLGLSLSYYHPSLDNLNSSFASQELLGQLPAWENFEISYMANASLRYEYEQMHRFAIEFGESYFRRERDNSESLYRVYRLGAQYDYIAIKQANNRPEVYVGGGAGWILANFLRTYSNNVGSSLVKDKWYLDACAGAFYSFTPRLGTEFEVRYMFVPTISSNQLGTDLKMSSLSAGIGLVFTR